MAEPLRVFAYLKGGIATAPSANDSSIGYRLQQLLALILTGVPFAGLAYAIYRIAGGQYPSATDLALLAGFYVATGIGVTVGFHRMLTHKAFETNPIVKAILLIFGTWSIQGAAITWAAIHQKHHANSDLDGDPHSPHNPVESFWHAHVGWMFGSNRGALEKYAKEQMKDPVVMFISRTAFWWAVLGFVIPFLIGGWTGLLYGGLVRVFLMHHSTWAVNSVCHIWGQRPFNLGKDLATNNIFVGIFALGEGWHNNHHAFPKSAFHGLRWWQVDASSYVIRTLEALRLVKNVYRVPDRLMEARLHPARPADPPSAAPPRAAAAKQPVGSR